MYVSENNSSAISPRLTLHQFEELYEEECLSWLDNCFDGLPYSPHDVYDAILKELRAHFKETKSYQISLFWKKFQTIGKKHKTRYRQMKDKNFQISETEFKKIVAELQANNKQLFEQVFLVHFKDCLNYLQANYQASYDDAYDATMNTFLLFHKKLKAEKIKYGNLRFLFTQMAIQNYLKWVAKKDQKTKSMDGIDLAVEGDFSLNQQQDAALAKAWEKLCDDCQQLLKYFYYEKQPLIALAKSLNKPPASLRKQKQRCMIKLRDAFFQLYPLNEI